MVYTSILNILDLALSDLGCLYQVDAFADEYTGKLKVGKLNVDDNGGSASRYNVRGIPTLLLFKEGKVVEQRVGAVSKADLVKMVEAHVG